MIIPIIWRYDLELLDHAYVCTIEAHPNFAHGHVAYAELGLHHVLFSEANVSCNHINLHCLRSFMTIEPCRFTKDANQ